MAEVVNTNVFDANKKFVDFAGLDYFWEKAKAHVDDADKALSDRIDSTESDIDTLKTKVGDENSGLVKDVKSIQDELDSLSGGAGSIATQIENAIATLDVEDAAVEGKYVSSVSEVDGKIVVSREDLPDFTDSIKDAKDAADAAQGTANEAVNAASTNATAIQGLAERMLAVEGIEHATDVVYGTDKYIYLVDKNGEKLGTGFDASEFVVDGMLDSVEFEQVAQEDGSFVKTNNLIFKFNTASGKEEIKINFAEYVDVYKADESSLTLDSASNTFSVKSVDASKTKLGSTITIAGGPLANDITDNWPTGAEWTSEGNKVIPAGKSLEEILTALFLKVVEGTVTWGTASWSPTINKPSVALSASGPVEVGTTVKVSTLSAGTASGKTRSVTCTCTEGYFNADADGNVTGDYQSGDKTISVNGSITGDAELACTWNGDAVEVTVNSTTLQVKEGTNTFAVSQSGQSATCNALPTTKVFASTNTKSPLAANATFSESKPADIPLSSSNSKTCSAQYKYFVGYSDKTAYNQFDSASVRALNAKTSWITVDGTTTILDDKTAIKSNGKSIVIACPNKYKLSTITNGVGANIVDNFTVKGSDGTVDVTTGNTTTVYHVYVYPITNGAEVEFKNLSLTKA